MTKKQIQILLVEDNPGDARLVKEAFAMAWEDDSYTLTHVTRLADALDHMHNYPVDVALLDLNLPDSNGVTTFYSFNSQAKGIPVLLLTGVEISETARELVRAGAQDFLLKGNLDHIVRAVSFAIERKEMEAQLIAEKERVSELLSQAPDGILYCDLEGKILEVNDQLCQMLGHRAHELRQFNIKDLGAPSFVSVLSHFGQHGERYSAEQTWLKKDGKEVSVEISSKKLTNAQVQVFVRDVSARVQMTRQLEESNRLNADLIDNLPYYLTIIDQNCKVVYSNGKHFPEFGDALLGENCKSMFGDSAAECANCPLHTKIVPGEQKLIQMTSKDGRDLEITQVGIEYLGKPALLNIFKDITETLRLEKQIKNTLEVQDFHHKNSPMAVIEYDDHQNIIKWTGRAEDIFGWKAEEVLGKNHLDFKWVYDDDRDNVSHITDVLMDGNYDRYTSTNRNYTKSGKVIMCDWYTSVLKDESGKVISLQSSVIDVTERHAIEQQLRESEKLFSAVFQGSPVGMVVRDKQGTILTYNDAWLNLPYVKRHLPENATNGKQTDLLSALGSGPLTRYRDQVMAVFRDGKELLLPEVDFSEGGQPLFVQLLFSPIKDEDGKVQKVVTFSEDVTKIKLSNEAHERENTHFEQIIAARTSDLRKINDDLTRISVAKDEFLANMSHELRTPLTGILGLAEALQMNVYGPLEGKQVEAAATIETSGRHLLSLINDILDLSKVNAAMLELDFTPTSLDSVCQGSMQLVRPQATKKNIQIEYSASPAGLVFRADPRRLKQAVVNLLVNAIKFSPKQGKVGIEAALDENGEKLNISVWDEGIGIDPESQKNLFEPFKQLDGTPAGEMGTGLGLSLVRKLALLHGGNIAVESRLGKGSRFTISLPYVKEELEPKKDAFKLPMPVKLALVVEKDERQAVRTTKLLESIGLTAQVSLDLSNAFQLAQMVKPDLIFVNEEQVLKEEEWLEKVRAEFDIPLILVGQRKDIAAHELGVAGMLREPFGQQQLYSEVHNALEDWLQKGRLMAANTARKMTSSLRQALIYVIDDDPPSVEVISDFLQRNNFRVESFTNGMDLLRTLEHSVPDVVMIDIQMPGMNGYDVIRAIRSHYQVRVRHLPILAITALAMSGDQERCLAAGANAYITKPLKLQEMTETLRLITRK